MKIETMKTFEPRWIATKHFEHGNANRNRPDDLPGQKFFKKSDAVDFARAENRRHSSGYVVLKLSGTN